MRRISSSAIVLLTFVASCYGGSSLPIGEVYSNVEGSYRLVVQNDSQVDVIEGNDAYSGSYLVQEDGRIRVALEILGTAMVKYYEPIDEGLDEIEPNGDRRTRLYDRKHISGGRDRYYCALMQNEIFEFSKAQVDSHSRKGVFAVHDAAGKKLRKARHGVQMQFLGVPKKYYLLKATHENCSRTQILGSGIEGGLLEFANNDEASKKWAALERQTETDLEQERAQEELEAEAAGYPTERELRAEFEARIADEGKGCMELKELEKTQGMELAPVPGRPLKFRVEFNATICFVEHCRWYRRGQIANDFLAERVATEDLVQYQVVPPDIFAAGSGAKLTGVQAFFKTDKGYVANRDYLEMTVKGSGLSTCP